MLKEPRAIVCLGLIVLLTLLTGCSGPGATDHPSAATPQMVFMMPTNGGVFPPGPDNTPWEIAVMNLDGSGRRQLTNDGKVDFLPHFSPDGSKIIFTKYEVGGYGNPNAQTDVFVYDLATSQETHLTHSGIAFQPAWSPDGKRIAYLSSRNGSLWIMNADGTGQKKLVSGDDPVWAPDGRMILLPACFRHGAIAPLFPCSGQAGDTIAVAGIAPDGTNYRLLFVTNGTFALASWQPIISA